VLRYGWFYGPGTSLVPGIAALVFDYRGFWGERRRGAPEPRPGGAVGDSLGGAHIVSVAADDPTIVAVVAQIPFNGFPRRVEGRSTAAALRLFGAIVWEATSRQCGRTRSRLDGSSR
jgi:uncharacterized protein